MRKFVERRNKKIFVTIVALLVVLCSSIGVCNSWFTDSSSNKYVMVDVFINSVSLNVYQNSVQINSSNPYISVGGEILPDQAVDLNLSLKNEDDGTGGTNVKFKIQYFLAVPGQDQEITSSVTTNVVAPTASSSGFVYDGSDYYVYQNLAGNATKLMANNSAVMISSFVVPYSVFYNSGNLLSGNSIKICLTVVAFE